MNNISIIQTFFHIFTTMWKKDIQIGDRLIEIDGSLDSDTDDFFRIDSYDESYLEPDYMIIDDGKRDILIPNINYKNLELIVDYISYEDDLLIFYFILSKGEFKGRKLFQRCAIQYCFESIYKCFEVNYKHRRLKNLKYLGI